MATVIIASKLPNALILKHPAKPTETVTIRGVNSSRIFAAGSGFSNPTKIVATTEVDASFWAAWKADHSHPEKPFKPLASGAIFEAKGESSAVSIAKEETKRRTGLEPMSTDGKDPRAPGVTTALAS